MKLLTAARQSPDFGLRLLSELPPAARAEVIRRWCLTNAPTTSLPLRAGLKKCGARPSAANDGLGAQLQAFARSIGRVG